MYLFIFKELKFLHQNIIFLPLVLQVRLSCIVLGLEEEDALAYHPI